MTNSIYGKLTGLPRQTVHDFRDRPAGVTFDAGLGPDLVLGSRHADRLSGGTGPDALFGGKGADWLRGSPGMDAVTGGRGNDSFVFAPGDLAPSRGPGHDHHRLVDTVLDFHGAGTSGRGEQDVIRLEGFGAGTTLKFAGHVQGQRELQYYRVADPTTPGSDGIILVRMADGTNRLTRDDVVVVPRNAPPAFTADAFEFALDEHNDPDAVAGRVPATDPDGDRLTYVILENGDDSYDNNVPFRVDADGTLIATAPLDFEMRASHSFTMRVTDAKGLSDTATVTVNVGDVSVPAALDFVFSGRIINFGDGQGGSDRSSSLGDTMMGSPVLGDMDRDGDLDIIATDGDTIELRLNDGRGNFSTAHPVSAGIDAAQLTLGDLDNDGDLDVLARSSGTASTILGDGQGGFVRGTDIAVAGSGKAHLGDLDGDGDLDFIAADREASAVQVRLGDGQGNFTAAPSVATGGYGVRALALGDLDNDGVLDLVASVAGSSSSIDVHLGNGDGTFDAAGSPIEIGYSEIALGDLDGNGILDLVVFGSGDYDPGDYYPAPTIRVFLGNGQGDFGKVADYRVSSYPYVPGPLALGDLDEDGDLDIAAASYTGRLSVKAVSLLNDGDGNFSKGGVFSSFDPFPSSLALGDLDGPARLTPSGLPDLGPLVPAPAELDWA